MRPLPRIVKLLIFGAGFVKVASFMSMPFLAIFLSRDSSIPIPLIGLVVGISPLFSVVGAFFGGQFSDRFGRKNILLLSLSMVALCYFGFFGAAHIQVSSLRISAFVAVNGLNGFFSWMFQPVSQALISDLLTPVERVKAFQLRYGALNLGAAIGPAIGGILGISSTSNSFLLTGILYLIFTLFLSYSLYGFLPATSSVIRKPRFIHSMQALASDRRLLLFVLAGMLFMMAYAQLESNLSQFLKMNFADGIKIFSRLLSLNGLTVILFQVPVYYLSAKLRPAINLWIGTSIFALGIFLFSIGGEKVELYYLAMIILSIGEILVFPVQGLFVDSIAPENLRGTYFGAGLLRQFGLFLGPPLGGFLLSWGWGRGLFICASGLSIISGVIFYYGEKITRSDAVSLYV
jgi:MFS family permease